MICSELLPWHMTLPWGMTKPQFKAFLACIICAVMATFTTLMVSAAVRQISKSYSVSYLNGIWVAECSALASIAFSMISADLSDKFGKRRIMAIGTVSLIISSIVAAFSFDFLTLITSRVIAGAGAAMVFSSNVSILADLCRKEYLSEIMSFNHAATSIGGACGPLLGQYISVTFGLRALFLSTIPLCVVALIMIGYADNLKTDPEKRINYPLHALVAITIGITVSAIMCTSQGSGVLWIVAAVACSIAFFFYRRSKNKIFDFSIMHNREFSLAVIIGLLFTICVYAVDNTMSYYLQMLGGRTLSFFGVLAITTGSLAAFTKSLKPIIQTVASPAIARFNRGRDATLLSLVGFMTPLLSVSLVFSLHNISYAPGWIIIVCIVISVLIGLGNSLFKPMNKSMMMASVSGGQRNAASSVSNLIDNLGRVVGIFVMVNMLDLMGGITETSLKVCMNVIAVMVAVFSVIGLYLCLRRRHRDAASKVKGYQ